MRNDIRMQLHVYLNELLKTMRKYYTILLLIYSQSTLEEVELSSGGSILHSMLTTFAAVTDTLTA